MKTKGLFELTLILTKPQKSSQGTSILSRLIGRSTPERGRDDMKFGKKGWVFAGTGTALALVLVLVLTGLVFGVIIDFLGRVFVAPFF